MTPMTPSLLAPEAGAADLEGVALVWLEALLGIRAAACCRKGSRTTYMASRRSPSPFCVRCVVHGVRCMACGVSEVSCSNLLHRAERGAEKESARDETSCLLQNVFC